MSEARERELMAGVERMAATIAKLEAERDDARESLKIYRRQMDDLGKCEPDGRTNCMAEDCARSRIVALVKDRDALRAEVLKFRSERDALSSSNAGINARNAEYEKFTQELLAKVQQLTEGLSDEQHLRLNTEGERDALRELAGELLEIVQGHHIEDDGDGPCPHCTLLARAKALGVPCR